MFTRLCLFESAHMGRFIVLLMNIFNVSTPAFTHFFSLFVIAVSILTANCELVFQVRSHASTLTKDLLHDDLDDQRPQLQAVKVGLRVFDESPERSSVFPCSRRVQLAAFTREQELIARQGRRRLLHSGAQEGHSQVTRLRDRQAAAKPSVYFIIGLF